MTEEYKGTFQRAFLGQSTTTYIIMDGHTACRNTYLRNAWQWMVNNGLIDVHEVGDEQYTQLRGYISKKGQQYLAEEELNNIEGGGWDDWSF